MNTLTQSKCSSEPIKDCRLPEVVERASCLEDTTNTMLLEISELEAKLQRVLRAENTVVCETECDVKQAVMHTQLGQDLRNTNDRLWSAVYRLRDITSRIEV